MPSTGREEAKLCSKNVWQYEGRPTWQVGQRPHESNVMPTRSPTATLVTALPTCSTIPAPSWPSTAGSGTGYHWSRMIRSVWQMPAATTPTSTSSGRSSPSSSSCRANGADVLSVTAAVILIRMPLRESVPFVKTLV